MCISSRPLIPSSTQIVGVDITVLIVGMSWSVIKTVNGQEMTMPMVFAKFIRMALKVSGRRFATSFARFGVFIRSFSPVISQSVSSSSIENLSLLTSYQNSFKHRIACNLDMSHNHIFLWICQGLAFFLFVRSFVPTAWKDAGVLTACFAFA